MARPSKIVSMTEHIDVRVDPLQKETILSAQFSKGTATVAREVLVLTAELASRIKAGEITPDQAAEAYKTLLAGLIKVTLPEDKDLPGKKDLP